MFNKHPVYRINTPTRHIVNKPILASSCDERFAIELISVLNLSEFNKGYYYILTAKLFSSQVWEKALKDKVLSALKVYLKNIFLNLI